jgi:carotenoid cleavage dioxygenase-like enzyme
VIKTDDPWFVLHLSNAFEQTTGHIVAFCTGWDKVTQGPFLSDWGGDVPLYEDVPTTFLFRLEVDVAAGTGRNRKT